MIEDEEQRSRNVEHPILSLINLARLTRQSLRQTYNQSEMEHTWLEVNYVAEAYTTYKERDGLLDFTDLLELFLASIEEVCPQFDLCFVDEAQDLSPLQWEIAHALDKRPKRFYVAGDDDHFCRTRGEDSCGDPQNQQATVNFGQKFIGFAHAL